MTGVGFACLTICARSLWGGRGVGPASQNRLNLLSRRCGPGGGVAFVFIHALALRVCLLLCWRQATQQEGALKAWLRTVLWMHDTVSDSMYTSCLFFGGRPLRWFAKFEIRVNAEAWERARRHDFCLAVTKVLFFFTYRTRKEACNPEAVGSFSGMVGGFFSTRGIF